MISVRRPTRSDNIPARIVINALIACCALHNIVSPINGTPDCDNCNSRNASDEFPNAKIELIKKYLLQPNRQLDLWNIWNIWNPWNCGRFRYAQ